MYTEFSEHTHTAETQSFGGKEIKLREHRVKHGSMTPLIHGGFLGEYSRYLEPG